MAYDQHLKAPAKDERRNEFLQKTENYKRQCISREILIISTSRGIRTKQMAGIPTNATTWQLDLITYPTKKAAKTLAFNPKDNCLDFMTVIGRSPRREGNLGVLLNSYHHHQIAGERLKRSPITINKWECTFIQFKQSTLWYRYQTFPFLSFRDL